MMQGEEWIVEGFGCSASRLRDPQVLRELCQQIIDDLDLHVMGEPHWEQFPAPGGVTGLYLLSESHLACHTWPEHGTASFNLFTCRDRVRWTWEEALSSTLRALRVDVRRISRGVLPRQASDSTARSAAREPALRPACLPRSAQDKPRHPRREDSTRT